MGCWSPILRCFENHPFPLFGVRFYTHQTVYYLPYLSISHLAISLQDGLSYSSSRDLVFGLWTAMAPRGHQHSIQLCLHRETACFYGCAVSLPVLNLFFHEFKALWLIETSTQDLFPVLDLKRPKRNFRRWACPWQTILLSSLGKTLYPYSRYIRTLNLHHLEELLICEELHSMLRK